LTQSRTTPVVEYQLTGIHVEQLATLDAPLSGYHSGEPAVDRARNSISNPLWIRHWVHMPMANSPTLDDSSHDHRFATG
jgi:hypothetical protein